VGLCPFGGGGVGSPSNTMWPWTRPTCMPSFILIRPTVWPQCTNVTNRTGQDRQRTGSIGRTVLQTVGQKRRKILVLPLQLNLKHSLLVLSTLPFSQFTYRKCSSCLFNARSIVNKTCELHHMLYSGKYQILLVIVFGHSRTFLVYLSFKIF